MGCSHIYSCYWLIKTQLLLKDRVNERIIQASPVHQMRMKMVTCSLYMHTWCSTDMQASSNDSWSSSSTAYWNDMLNTVNTELEILLNLLHSLSPCSLKDISSHAMNYTVMICSSNVQSHRILMPDVVDCTYRFLCIYLQWTLVSNLSYKVI